MFVVIAGAYCWFGAGWGDWFVMYLLLMRLICELYCAGFDLLLLIVLVMLILCCYLIIVCFVVIVVCALG